MKELATYLLENLYFDFQGEISVEKIREYLREDQSPEARVLFSRIIEDNGVEDLLITLADCLRDHIRTGVTEATIEEQLNLYTDS